MIQDDKNNVLYKFINLGYRTFVQVWSFSKKLLWAGSIAAFMVAFPFFISLMMDNNEVLMQVERMQMDRVMGEPPAPEIRPF